MEEGYYGCLGTGEETRDFLGAEIAFPKAPKTYSGIQYNQKDVSYVSCTVHGAMGAYSDLTGHEFTLEERKAVWKEALELGANPDVGWFIKDAVKLVQKTMEDVNYFRVSLNGIDFREALEQGYSVVCGYRGNKDFGIDFKEDGILDLKDLGVTTYGHCIRISQGEEPGMYDIVIDNYLGRPKYNVYKIPEENFKALVANRVFFKNGYVYVMSKQLDAPVWAQDAWAWAIDKGITNGERPNDSITRAEMVTMLHRALHPNE